MKHISRFNEELSPSTYDSVERSGRIRGDTRGREISNTAKGLKYRQYLGVTIRYKSKGSNDVKNDNISVVNSDNDGWVSFETDNTRVLLILRVSTSGGSLSITSDNSINYEVDRKTANLFVKAMDEFCGKDFKASDVPQF